MSPWMAILLELIHAGVCVPAPPVTLQGAKVQTVVCATSGVPPEGVALQPTGPLNPMHPKLRERG